MDTSLTTTLPEYLFISPRVSRRVIAAIFRTPYLVFSISGIIMSLQSKGKQITHLAKRKAGREKAKKYSGFLAAFLLLK
jgi:hypothetical protein